jgi:hypothetical protein
MYAIPSEETQFFQSEGREPLRGRVVDEWVDQDGILLRITLLEPYKDKIMRFEWYDEPTAKNIGGWQPYQGATPALMRRILETSELAVHLGGIV